MTSNPANMLCVVVQLPMRAALSLQGKGRDLWQVAAPEQYAFKTLITQFAAPSCEAAALRKTCISLTFVTFMFTQLFTCYMLKAMSQREWESVYTACYQWAVLLSAGTVYDSCSILKSLYGGAVNQ